MNDGRLVACMLSAFVLVVMTAGAVGADEINRDNFLYGETTKILITVTGKPVYNKSDGRTRVGIFNKEDGSPIRTVDLDGIWHFFGYHKDTKRYVLAGEFQVGAWLPLKSVAYVDEKTAELTYFAAVSPDWLAFSAVASPDLRYFAFVGARDITVLDTVTDTMKIAGKSPMPPPVYSDYCIDAVKTSGRAGMWNWGDACADGYTEMDEGIIVFINGIMKISYGKDTYKKRSAKRRVEEINLEVLFKGSKNRKGGFPR